MRRICSYKNFNFSTKFFVKKKNRVIFAKYSNKIIITKSAKATHCHCLINA